MVLQLINCSGCHVPLQLPPSAPSVRCALCDFVTHVAGGGGATPPPQRGPPPPSGSRGRKRAVVCAVSYRKTRFHLKGSINDAKCMKYFLTNRYRFPQESILTLTEEETDPDMIPTKYNIRRALYWLVHGCQPGDSLVFHYSGHGSQQRNYNGEELDGYDETLCPMDFQTQGMIVDDELNATIVRPLPHGVKLHAIIDACHSGTMLDLPFLCRMDRNGQYVWEDHRPRSGTWKGTNGGEAISFSGCDDNQTSADTSALSRNTSTGAMTFCFIKAIEQGHGDTYGSILNAMRSTIRNTSGATAGGPITSLLSMLLTGGSLGALKQEPQLTSNYTIDVYKKPFSL
ncbi:uncharacterized protein M6B38_263880 [Iris pallida]|uniref:Metacaspase-1 n=1 Tax=Iris pallida TaxID=29817 RepID=A0AAX6ICW1_IRIPA|nr:uncharacterized protein M6B38_263880 [Iris pallida]